MPADRTGRLLYALVLAAFVATAAGSLVLTYAMPSQLARSSSFRTPILAFELARSQHDLLDVFGPQDDPGRPARLQAMLLGHQLDAAFLLLYNGFLALMLAAIARESGRPWLYAAIAIPSIAAACDAWENVVLVALLGALDRPEPLLATLAPATWSKWSAIASATALCGLGLFRMKRRVIGGAAYVPLAGVALAYLSPARFGEAMVPTLTIAWLLLALHAAQRLRRSAR